MPHPPHGQSEVQEVACEVRAWEEARQVLLHLQGTSGLVARAEGGGLPVLHGLEAELAEVSARPPEVEAEVPPEKEVALHSIPKSFGQPAQ